MSEVPLEGLKARRGEKVTLLMQRSGEARHPQPHELYMGTSLIQKNHPSRNSIGP
jgi:hypothetical protein